MRVAVIGAGLQGACIALELAGRGVEVDLVDVASTPMDRTSLRNEGKIHLGLVYANAGRTPTASVMLEGALCFGSLLQRWTAGAFATVPRSARFTYLVADDSMLSTGQLHEHYDGVEREYRRRLADTSLDYLGARPDRLWRPVEPARRPGPDGHGSAAAAVETEERAVDLRALANVVRTAIADQLELVVLWAASSVQALSWLLPERVRRAGQRRLARSRLYRPVRPSGGGPAVAARASAR